MFVLIYVLMSSLQDKTSGNNWNTFSHFLHGRRCILGYRSGHMNTCYLISSTFSHHAGRVSTLDRHWSRSEKASLHVTTVSVSASIKALRQGCSLKSFLCSEDRGLAEEAGCRRLRAEEAEEAERPAPCYSAAAALPFKQQPQHQSCRSRVQCFRGIKQSVTTIFIYSIISRSTFSDL